MKKTVAISEDAINLAIKFLREHAFHLGNYCHLPASAGVVGAVVKQIEEEIALRTPMTPEEQAAALTKIMGCGPEDESKGNKLPTSARASGCIE